MATMSYQIKSSVPTLISLILTICFVLKGEIGASLEILAIKSPASFKTLISSSDSEIISLTVKMQDVFCPFLLL
jgi:hypothetical protein